MDGRAAPRRAGGGRAVSGCVCLRVCVCVHNNTMEEEQIWAGAGCSVALAQRVAVAGRY